MKLNGELQQVKLLRKQAEEFYNCLARLIVDGSTSDAIRVKAKRLLKPADKRYWRRKQAEKSLVKPLGHVVYSAQVKAK